MSTRLPQEMRRIARVLMAGEEILYWDKPSHRNLLIYEGVMVAGGFVILWGFIALFSGLPAALSAATALFFSLAAAGIVHFFLGTSVYIITDKRVLIVNELSAELRDSCDIHEVTGVKPLGFGKTLVVERASGKPLRLFALRNRDEAEQALIGS